MELKKWQQKHKILIQSLLKEINQKSKDYVLKGGTALMMCYDLDRFSEDIDLDSINHNDIFGIIDTFCKNNGYEYRIAKDTDTVKRFMIHYGNKIFVDREKPLKVEISFRNKFISEDSIENINGICVYEINKLAILKANAYNGRNKIRDLYDISFLCTEKIHLLTNETISIISDIVNYKGIEQFDFLVNAEEDELINYDLLEERFLETFDNLGLINENKDYDYIEESPRPMKM